MKMKRKSIKPLAFTLLFLILTVETYSDISTLNEYNSNQTYLPFTGDNETKCISFRHVPCKDKKSFFAVMENQLEYYKPEELMGSLKVPQEGCVCYRYIPCQGNWRTLSTSFETNEEFLLRAYTKLFLKFKLQEREREEEMNNAFQLVNQLKKEIQNVRDNLTSCRNQVNDQETQKKAEEKYYWEFNVTFNHKLLLGNNESSALKEENEKLKENSNEYLMKQSELLALLEVEQRNHLSSNTTFGEEMQLCNNKTFQTMDQYRILKMNLTALETEQSKTLRLLDVEKHSHGLSNEKLLVCNSDITHFKEENGLLMVNITKSQNEQNKALELLKLEKQNHLSSNKTYEEKMKVCNNKSSQVLEKFRILEMNLTILLTNQTKILELLDFEKEAYDLLNTTFNEKVLLCNNEIYLLKDENNLLNVNVTKSQIGQNKVLESLKLEQQRHLSSNKTFDEKLSTCNSKNSQLLKENEILRTNFTKTQNEGAKLLRLLETEKEARILLEREFEEKLLVCGNETLLTIEENQIFRRNLAKCQEDQTHLTIDENQNCLQNLAQCQMELRDVSEAFQDELNNRAARTSELVEQTCGNKNFGVNNDENKRLHELIARLQSDQKIILALLEDEKERCRLTTANLNQAMTNCNNDMDFMTEKTRVLNANLTKIANEQKETLKLLQAEKDNHRISNATFDEKLLLCNNKFNSTKSC